MSSALSKTTTNMLPSGDHFTESATTQRSNEVTSHCTNQTTNQKAKLTAKNTRFTLGIF